MFSKKLDNSCYLKTLLSNSTQALVELAVLCQTFREPYREMIQWGHSKALSWMSGKNVLCSKSPCHINAPLRSSLTYKEVASHRNTGNYACTHLNVQSKLMIGHNDNNHQKTNRHLHNYNTYMMFSGLISDG